jgi:hypothetical protein
MTMMLSKHQRREAGRLGGLATSAQYDSRALAANARSTFAAQLRMEADPMGTLDEAEVVRRVKALRKLHALKMAHRSAEVRAQRAGKVRCVGCGRWHKPAASL